uniref:Uncharacterized protein n=1 Tax=Anguilla anguilla TaxID=7936 RepID=A0A0E9XKS8_ANGAN
MSINFFSYICSPEGTPFEDGKFKNTGCSFIQNQVKTTQLAMAICGCSFVILIHTLYV